MLSGCQVLDLSNLGLTRLPDALPDGLTYFDAVDNHLKSLPDNLPAGLTPLDTIFTLLTYRPDNLPAGVSFLALRNDSQNLMSIRG